MDPGSEKGEKRSGQLLNVEDSRRLNAQERVQKEMAKMEENHHTEMVEKEHAVEDNADELNARLNQAISRWEKEKVVRLETRRELTEANRLSLLADPRAVHFLARALGSLSAPSRIPRLALASLTDPTRLPKATKKKITKKNYKKNGTRNSRNGD